jgi:hypothetical protein
MDHGTWACPMPAVADDVRGQVRRHRDSLRTEVARETGMRIDGTCFSDWALSMCTRASNDLAAERKMRSSHFTESGYSILIGHASRLLRPVACGSPVSAA